MHILFLTRQFPSYENDTKGIFLFRTISKLSQKYSITVICLHSIAPPVFSILKNIKNAKRIYNQWNKKFPKNPQPPKGLNAKVIYVKYWRLPRTLFPLLESWFGYFALKKHLKNINTQNAVIQATWLFPDAYLAHLIHKKYYIPYIPMLMGSDVHYLKKNSRQWNKTKTMIESSVCITSVSKALFEALEKKNLTIPTHKKYITHTIYETGKFSIKDKDLVKNQLNLKNEQKIIFYAGTLRNIKNVDVLIKAFALISKKHTNILLLIAGKGDREGNLKELAKKYLLEEQVMFLGILNGSEIIEYYNAADIFCLPSKNEGTPNVVIESLLCGTPVVASKVGEIPYLIHHEKNGLLAEPNSIESLAENLEKALNISWDRSYLRESVSFLSVENVISEYAEVYNRVKLILDGKNYH